MGIGVNEWSRAEHAAAPTLNEIVSEDPQTIPMPAILAKWGSFGEPTVTEGRPFGSE